MIGDANIQAFQLAIGKKYRLPNGDVCTYVTNLNQVLRTKDIAKPLVFIKENKKTLVTEPLTSMFEQVLTKPTVNWSAIPSWCNWFAISDSGQGTAYKDRPTASTGGYMPTTKIYAKIPSEFYTRGDVPWIDTLMERPNTNKV